MSAREPGVAEGEDDDVADGHRRKQTRPRAVPASVGQEADERGGGEEADQIAAGRAGHVGGTRDRAGEDRGADEPFDEIERHGRRAEPRAVGGGEDEHDQRLQSHRHGIERNLDLGRHRERQRAADDQRRVARKPGVRRAGHKVATSVASRASVMGSPKASSVRFAS